MAVLKVLPEQHIISGLKGKVDFYLWNGIAVARKWPRSPGHDRAAAVQSVWPSFSYAASEWSNLSAEVQATYKRMAEGTGLTGRDMFTRAYLTGLFPYAIPMEDDMKFVYADNTPVIVNNVGLTPPTGWIEVDVRGVTSEKAVAIFLQCKMAPTAWVAPNWISIDMMKQGAIPPQGLGFAMMTQNGCTGVGAVESRHWMIGVDIEQKFQYILGSGAPAPTLDLLCVLFGYLEAY